MDLTHVEDTNLGRLLEKHSRQCVHFCSLMNKSKQEPKSPKTSAWASELNRLEVAMKRTQEMIETLQHRYS